MRVITFDLDGVIIPIMEYGAKLTGLDVSKRESYGCEVYGKEKHEELNEIFRQRSCFEQAGFYVDMEELRKKIECLMAKHDIKITINSNSLSQEVLEYKLEMISEKMGYVDSKDIILNNIHIESATKRIKKSDVIVEDWEQNIYNSEGYKYGILIKNGYTKQLELPSNIVLVDNILDAVDCIEKLIDEDLI